MNFEIIDNTKESNLITSFELDGNPFKIGEFYYLTIHNNDPSFWDKAETNKKYKIINIEHFSRQMYLPNHTYHFTFTVSVTVEEVIED